MPLFLSPARRTARGPRCLLACALVWTLAGGAASEPLSEVERWVPALDVSSGVFFQKADGSVASTARGAFDDDVLAVFPFVEGSVELMSPGLGQGQVRPRLFVRGGAGRSWDARHRKPKEGNASELVIPPNFPVTPLEAVQGQGSETRHQAKPYFYTAAAGLALSMPFDESRALRIRSSLEYRYSRTQIEAVLSQAEAVNDDEICPCRLGRLQATNEADQHALGVGLELELDAARLGPFLLAVHAGGQAHRILEGHELRVSAAGIFDDGMTPLDVRSDVKLERWNFRLGVGVRFRWVPE